jgi:MFS family permease
VPTSAAPSDWRRIVVVFWLTSLVEGIGVSQVFALLPAYLAEIGVAEADRLPFVGLFSSLLFVLGLPLVPLWGVWADKYSRKAVIVRSAVVEAVVFAGMALSNEPWQVAVSVLLIGFQLGNTGVMLAGIRDVTPSGRLGRTIAIFGASGPIGFAVGPGLAGLLIDGFGASIATVFAVSAVLSLGTAALVAFGSREVRPAVVPEGRVLELAFGAIRAVLGDPAVRRIFAVFAVSFLAAQTARPYIPILVEAIVGRGPGLASSIALVVGTASLVGALLSPAAGALGDRIGFQRVLVVSLAALGIGLGLMTVAPTVPLLALIAVAVAGAQSTVSAMVFGLLATEVAPERRSTTLNLVYLPLYIAGIVGPAISAGVVGLAGLQAPFFVAAAVGLGGAVGVALRRRAMPAPLAGLGP